MFFEIKINRYRPSYVKLRFRPDFEVTVLVHSKIAVKVTVPRLGVIENESNSICLAF